MVGFGEAVLDAILLADAIKNMVDGVLIAFAVGELDAVIGEHGVELVGHAAWIASWWACGRTVSWRGACFAHVQAWRVGQT
jgi:hypothetical protein